MRTRARIVASAAPLFNTKGFAGTSIGDVLEAAELEKGGLYRHFASKDELALAAFDHAAKLLFERHEGAARKASLPLEALLLMIESVGKSTRNPSVAGGCPILNTATEADDAHPALRARAAAAMRRWQRGVEELAVRAAQAGQLRADVDAKALAAVVVSSLEGAIMTTALLRDHRQIDAVAAHVRDWVLSLRREVAA